MRLRLEACRRGSKRQNALLMSIIYDAVGTLKSGRSGKKVKSRKQAIAIGLSEARKEGKKVPAKTSKKSSKKKTTKKKTTKKKKSRKTKKSRS